jgi:tetratricopeptide (TPR) repeat protein
VFPVLLFGLLWAAHAGIAGEDPLSRARDHLAVREFSKALEAAREAVRADRKDGEARFLEGEALSGLARWDEAVNAYEGAVELSPAGSEAATEALARLCGALLGKAHLQRKAGDLNRALDTLNDALIRRPEFLDGLLMRAELLEAMGRLDEAEDEIHTALRNAPRDPKVLTAATRFYARTGRAEEALPHIEVLLETGEYDIALGAADEVVAARAHNAQAHAVRAEALAGRGKWGGAIPAYEEAIRLLPEESIKKRCVRGVSRALFRMAGDQLDSGETLEALETLNDAIIWDIDFIDAILMRSTVLERLGRVEEAEDEFRTALRKAPRAPAVLHHGALFYARSRRFDEALPLLDRLIAGTSAGDDSQTLAWAHLTVGKIHLEEGERGRGYRHILRASELAPHDEEVRGILGNLEGFREQAGRITRAENALLLACLVTLLAYAGIGFAGWRFLKRKGLL